MSGVSGVLGGCTNGDTGYVFVGGTPTAVIDTEACRYGLDGASTTGRSDDRFERIGDGMEKDPSDLVGIEGTISSGTSRDLE